MLENASEILYFLSVAKFPSIDTDNLFSFFSNYSEYLLIYWWIDSTSVYSLMKAFNSLMYLFPLRI